MDHPLRPTIHTTKYLDRTLVRYSLGLFPSLNFWGTKQSIKEFQALERYKDQQNKNLCPLEFSIMKI
jgi:hypothetical protein